MKNHFPLCVDEDLQGMNRSVHCEKMKSNNIFGRRYFYPLISQFPTYRGLESALPGKTPVAEKITEQVICLPLYPELKPENQNAIVSIIFNE